MKTRSFKFNFENGHIEVLAYTKENAKILAQAEAIRRGWDPKVKSKPRTEKLDLTINWDQLNTAEEAQLWTLLRKACYCEENEGGNNK